MRTDADDGGEAATAYGSRPFSSSASDSPPSDDGSASSKPYREDARRHLVPRLIALSIAAGLGFVLLQSAVGERDGPSGPHELLETFDTEGTLVERARIEQSTSPNWWLSSGGMLTVENGFGRTLTGDLTDSPWTNRYARSNPVDSDDGRHPQNLFRLVTKGRWHTSRQELSFRIRAIRQSPSRERDRWSGLFLFQRYLDGDNLYTTGLRVDGAAVIKRKRGGKYETLEYRRVYTSPLPYDRETNPTLLPLDRWIRLRTEIGDRRGGNVEIRMWIDDPERTQGWQLVIEAIDGGSRSAAPIRAAGHSGIRTDFMDVEFDRYAIRERPPKVVPAPPAVVNDQVTRLEPSAPSAPAPAQH